MRLYPAFHSVRSTGPKDTVPPVTLSYVADTTSDSFVVMKTCYANEKYWYTADGQMCRPTLKTETRDKTIRMFSLKIVRNRVVYIA